MQKKQHHKALSTLLTVSFIFLQAIVADNTLTKEEKTSVWELLFNGSSFKDWKIDKWNPESFSIEDASIKCHGKASMIYYDKKTDYKNFHFKAKVKTKKGANSGIFFHSTYQDKGWPNGHEAQVNCTQKDPVKTGSIYIVQKYLKQAHQDDVWFNYEIIVEGQRIITKVDGVTISDYTEAPTDNRRKLSQGTFGLQAHDPGSVVYFKDIKVKTL